MICSKQKVNFSLSVWHKIAWNQSLILPLHVSDLLALPAKLKKHSWQPASPPVLPEPVTPAVNLMDQDLPLPSEDQKLPGALMQEKKQGSPSKTQENIPLDEHGFISCDKENAINDEKEPLKEQTSNPQNSGHTHSKSASSGHHKESRGGLPRHRHACVVWGCPACCCHRKMIVFWVILFLLLQVVPVLILILDGIYSSRRGHTYSR